MNLASDIQDRLWARLWDRLGDRLWDRLGARFDHKQNTR